ncbi:hypothetical protein E8E11_000457 [Didymella keratinophila]|nr:hypothetical protein E8E11_000457 [Didymella keratinophila]
MALEDAAALGIPFNKDYFKGDVKDSLAVYEKVRLPRATKVQASAAKAADNINERIMFLGFSSNTPFSNYKVEDEKKRLTIEEMNGYEMYKDIDQAFAERRVCHTQTKKLRAYYNACIYVPGLPAVDK